MESYSQFPRLCETDSNAPENHTNKLDDYDDDYDDDDDDDLEQDAYQDPCGNPKRPCRSNLSNVLKSIASLPLSSTNLVFNNLLQLLHNRGQRIGRPSLAPRLPAPWRCHQHLRPGDG